MLSLIFHILGIVRIGRNNKGIGARKVPPQEGYFGKEDCSRSGEGCWPFIILSHRVSPQSKIFLNAVT